MKIANSFCRNNAKLKGGGGVVVLYVAASFKAFVNSYVWSRKYSEWEQTCIFLFFFLYRKNEYSNEDGGGAAYIVLNPRNLNTTLSASKDPWLNRSKWSINSVASDSERCHPPSIDLEWETEGKFPPTNQHHFPFKCRHPCLINDDIWNKTTFQCCQLTIVGI